MSLPTYLWHYTVARLLYDDVVRPLGVAGLGIGALAVGLILMRVRRGRR